MNQSEYLYSKTDSIRRPLTEPCILDFSKIFVDIQQSEKRINDSAIGEL